jgi:sigma-E factor negative regulatory protein RseA
MHKMKPNTPQSAIPDAGIEQASRLSAFMDGEVGVHECQALVRASCKPSHVSVDAPEAVDTVMATWSEYHVISRVLQGQPAMSGTSPQAFLERWRAQVGGSLPLANVPTHLDQVGQVLSPRQSPGLRKAANDARLHWFAAAAVTGLAVALIWQLQPSSAPAGHAGQVAALADKNNASAPAVAPVQQQEDMAMIRNPALDELLLAHRRQGGASALQVPAGFMRGASTSNSP